MKRPALVLVVAACGAALSPCARSAPHEVHQQLAARDASATEVALTLDACGGAYDRELIATLVRLRVPATLFVTRRWLDANPQALRELLAQPDLFELENHGDAHVPAMLGGTLYGLHAARSRAAIDAEISGGARAVTAATGRAPRWFRGAGAAYDTVGEQSVATLGYQVAGFSVSADDGATLGAAQVARRLLSVAGGDIVIAHMNKPGSGTAAGFATALPALLARGVRFIRLSQARGVQPAPRAVAGR